MRSIVVLTFIALSFVFSLTNHFYAMLIYWWFTIFRPQDWIWMDVQALHLSLVAGLIFVIPSFLSGIFPRCAHPISVLTLIWLLIITAATSINGCQGFGWSSLDFLMRLMLVVYLTDRLLISPQRFFWLVFVIATSLGFYSSKAGFSALLSGGASQYGLNNLTGTFSGGNAFALGTAMIVFLLLASAQNVLYASTKLHDENLEKLSPWKRLVGLGLFMAIPFSMYNIMSLSSRGSSIGLAGGILAFILLQRRRRIVWFLCILIIGPLVVFFMPLPQGYEKRIESAFVEQEHRDESSKGRLHFWDIAIDMASNHFIGVGAKCYQHYYDIYDRTNGQYGKRRSVHSSHFQILAETGYVGFSTWIFLFVYSFYVLLRIRARSKEVMLDGKLKKFFLTYSNAIMASMVTFLVGGAFYEFAHNEITWLTFILVAVLDRMSRAALEEAILLHDSHSV